MSEGAVMPSNPNPDIDIEIRLKRIYEPVSPQDGYRLLVDRMWRRGISPRRSALDGWARELAPSDALRRWYADAPGRFAEFERRYRAELAARGDELNALRRLARVGTLTLVFAARDTTRSNAMVLAAVLVAGANDQVDGPLHQPGGSLAGNEASLHSSTRS
jgi:uncharacterized protein YeaO (DUF488 family)